ncbi:MAG: serine hydrolase [Terracidiphilus sp.]
MHFSRFCSKALVVPVCVFLGAALHAQTPTPQEDSALDQQLQSIAAAHHGRVALFAHNLKTGQTASLSSDLPVKTASTIKMGILLDAAEQTRAGHASLAERLVLTKENQVEGSGVLGELTPPIALTLGDVLTLMVVVSDNTATNMAIDRLGLEHIDNTLRAAGLKNTWLYKKVYVPATGPMPADQPQFGLGKTTPREMASIMERFATCNLDLDGKADSDLSQVAPKAQLAPPQGSKVVCGAILEMLRHQQDRDGLPRYIENLDTSEHGSAIANKTGALDQVRNDVALIASKNGPIVIAGFTFDNADQRWNGDNEGQITLAKLGQAIVHAWSPAGLDAQAIDWDIPLQSAKP